MSNALQPCYQQPRGSPADLAKIGGLVRGRARTRPTVANKIQAILHLERCNAKDFAFGDCRIQKIFDRGAVRSKDFTFEIVKCKTF
jgi:hypothetical protein